MMELRDMTGRGFFIQAESCISPKAEGHFVVPHGHVTEQMATTGIVKFYTILSIYDYIADYYLNSMIL